MDLCVCVHNTEIKIKFLLHARRELKPIEYMANDMRPNEAFGWASCAVCRQRMASAHFAPTSSGYVNWHMATLNEIPLASSNCVREIT